MDDDDEFGAIYGDVQDEKKPSIPVEQPLDEGDEDALFKQLYGEEAAADVEASAQKQAGKSGMLNSSFSREISLMSSSPSSIFSPRPTHHSSSLLPPYLSLSLPFLTQINHHLLLSLNPMKKKNPMKAVKKKIATTTSWSL